MNQRIGNACLIVSALVRLHLAVTDQHARRMVGATVVTRMAVVTEPVDLVAAYGP